MNYTYRVSGKTFALPQAPKGSKVIRRPGGWLQVELPDGRRVRMALAERGSRCGVAISGRLWSGELARSAGQGAADLDGSDADLIAQFPGKVRKLLVEAGAVVKKGEPLLLVEAMKMEFAIAAPFDGTVSRVLVTEGQQLSPGDRFVDLDR